MVYTSRNLNISPHFQVAILQDRNDNLVMARTSQRTRIVGHGLLDGLARLADIAPAEIAVLAEDNDWLLVGEDFRAATEEVAEDPQVQACLKTEDGALVEA
jgi:hypothetical protein